MFNESDDHKEKHGHGRFYQEAYQQSDIQKKTWKRGGNRSCDSVGKV